MRQRITLLGPPGIEAVPTRFDLNSGKTAALLLYLAYQAAPVGRDTLLYLFWPDVPEAGLRVLRALGGTLAGSAVGALGRCSAALSVLRQCQQSDPEPVVALWCEQKKCRE